ncbi:MAG: helix-turn-helix domain-containing protein [Candidatus Nanohaloarchaea archaeon]
MDFFDLDEKEDKHIIFDVFGLNSLQKQLFEELRDKQLTVQELAEKVDRNRSTVQRALQDMLDKDIIMREGKTDKTVYYVYTTLPFEELKQLARQALDSWHEKVTSRLQ